MLSVTGFTSRTCYLLFVSGPVSVDTLGFFRMFDFFIIMHTFYFHFKGGASKP